MEVVSIEMGWYNVCIAKCPNGSFFLSEIGEIGW